MIKEGMCKGEILVEKMKDIGGHMEFCGIVVHGYTSGADERGVIRFHGFYTDKNEKEIKINHDIDFLDREKFYNRDGLEIDEPRIVLPVNIIHGPNT